MAKQERNGDAKGEQPEQQTQERQRNLTPVQQTQQYIARASSRQELEKVLPPSIPVDRFIRIAQTAIANNPELTDTDSVSLMNSLVRCGQDGLVPDNREAALVIFNTKVKDGNREYWVKKAQYMPMVDGILKRARMSGEIRVIAAKPVYEHDDFDYWMDEDGEHLNYKPNLRGARGDLQLVFAFARLNTGELVVETMTKDEIEQVRKASKNPDKGPWKDWYERMGLKAVLHRHARRLPNASEVMEITSRDSFMYDFDNMKDVTPRREALPTGNPSRPGRMASIIGQHKQKEADPQERDSAEDTASRQQDTTQAEEQPNERF